MSSTPVGIQCPKCDDVSLIDPARLGKTIRCRECGAAFVATKAGPPPGPPSPLSSKRGDAGTLPVLLRKELPIDLRDKPRPDEIIHHFGYIDTKGGCANPSSAKQWILVTNKRILFEASVKQGDGLFAKY